MNRGNAVIAPKASERIIACRTAGILIYSYLDWQTDRTYRYTAGITFDPDGFSLLDFVTKNFRSEAS